jgi:hypothetical protein
MEALEWVGGAAFKKKPPKSKSKAERGRRELSTASGALNTRIERCWLCGGGGLAASVATMLKPTGDHPR